MRIAPPAVNHRSVAASLSVCLSVSNFAYFRTDLHEIFRDDWQWASEQVIKFWWRSGSRIRIATLIRRALAEVCTVPVLLVLQICFVSRCIILPPLRVKLGLLLLFPFYRYTLLFYSYRKCSCCSVRTKNLYALHCIAYIAQQKKREETKDENGLKLIAVCTVAIIVWTKRVRMVDYICTAEAQRGRVSHSYAPWEYLR